MSENHEQNSPSAGTSDPEPETIIPPDAVELETEEADQLTGEKLETEEPPIKKPVIEELATPHRVVLWFEYETLRDKFREYWAENEEKLIAFYKIRGKKVKGGKIPNARKLAEKRVPLARLYGEPLTDLLGEMITRDILHVQGFQLFEYEKGKQPQLVAIVNFMPSLEVEGELAWECKRPALPPKQTQFEGRLKELQRQHRTLKDDPEGVISENSNVHLDIKATIEGKPYVSGTIIKQWVEVAVMPLPDLKEHLIGHKAGDEFECEYIANKRDTEHGGKTVRATITIHNLQQIEEPEVDDDLAKDAGFDDLKAFEKRFDSDYESYIERALQGVASEHVINQIARSSSLPPVPLEWVEVQARRMSEEHTARTGGNKRKAMEVVGAKDEAAFIEVFRGQLYREFIQQLAMRWYGEKYKQEPGSKEMFEDMVKRVRWTDDDEKA